MNIRPLQILFRSMSLGKLLKKKYYETLHLHFVVHLSLQIDRRKNTIRLSA